MNRGPLARLARILACALAFATPPGPAHAGPPAASVRVTAVARAVRFELSGGQGRIALARGAGVVVSGPAGGPWRVRLERGAAALAMPARGPGSLLLGNSGALVPAGGVVALRAGAPETALVLEGHVTSAGSSLPLEAGRALRFTEAAELVAVDGAPAAELVDVARAARGDAVPGMVDLACAVPLEERAVAVPAGLRLVRLDGGGAAVPVGAAGPVALRVSALRERIAVSLPGEGLSGPGLHIDLDPRRDGVSRSQVIAGARGLARFFVAPDWMATLAPESVVTLEAPAARPEAAALTVQRGAVMLESRAREIGAEEPWVPDWPRIVPGDGVVGSRTVVVAAGREAGGAEGRAFLERFRGAVRSGAENRGPATGNREPGTGNGERGPRRGGGAEEGWRTGDAFEARAAAELGVRVIAGSLAKPEAAATAAAPPIEPAPAPCEVITVFATLPAAPGELARALAVGLAGTSAAELEVGVFAALEGPGRACGAALLVLQPGGGSLPAALVVPERPASSAGPLAGPMQVLVVSGEDGPHAGLARAQLAARELAGPVAPGGTDGRLVAFGLLALAWWVRRTRWRWTRSLRASVDAEPRCARCALPLEIDAIGELPAETDAAAVRGLVRGQLGAEAVAPLRDEMRAVEGGDAELRYRLTGAWCVRCEEGSLEVELRRGDEGVDEAVFACAGARAHDAMRQLAGRPARS